MAVLFCIICSIFFLIILVLYCVIYRWYEWSLQKEGKKPTEMSKQTTYLINFNSPSFSSSFVMIKIVTELGHFHGECYALKESKTDVFHSIAGKLRETRYANMDPVYQLIMKASVGRAIKSVQDR